MNKENLSNTEFCKLYKNYLAHKFEDGILRAPHQDFWEVYLANALLEKHVTLRKDFRSSGAPDFFFEQDGLKIHIEAMAPGPGEGRHAAVPVPMLINEDAGNFESGNIPADQIRLRFTNALQVKTEQIEKWKDQGTIGATDAVILAINGHEALGGRASVDGYLEPKFIFQVLHDIGDSFINQKGERFLERTRKIRKGATKIENEWSFLGKIPACGVLYSNVSLGDLSPQHKIGNDFEYFQNPSLINLERFFNLWRAAGTE